MADRRLAMALRNPYTARVVDIIVKRHCRFSAGLLLAVCLPLQARDPGAISLGFARGRAQGTWHAEALGEQTYAGRAWATEGVGFSLFRSHDERLYGGLDLRLRANVPARIAPYAGFGIFLGSWPRTVWDDADADGGEEARIEREYLLAVYPEAGLHLWLTGGLRLSAHARYYVTTRGRDGNDVFYGLSIGWKPAGF